MTSIDVLYHFAEPPREASMLAIASLREVYGIRRIQFDERGRSIRVEFDATRLSEPVVRQLLRRAGLTLSDAAASDPVPDVPAAPAV